jgi:hypothetical protein
LLSLDLTFDYADSFGLDRNLSVDGVRVFSEMPLLGNESEVQFGAWTMFITGKIAIVPDLTEPYEYPDIDRLKAEISS